MTLHLAGQYQASNEFLEQAEEEMEALYTRRLRTQAAAFLTNDTELPYEGEPYEQVMINVLKAINYALLGERDEALVEARRIDHRLNVLADQVERADGYREDMFARYLTGILYEAAGDLNDAFIAYRKAYDGYRLARSWYRKPMPSQLPADLLRMTDALHLSTEHEEYRQAFPETAWQPVSTTQQLAQVVIISYNGRAPRKEDLFIDLPISLDALRLVLVAKGVMGPSTQDTRAAESLLYGLRGHIVRVALPRLVPQKSQVAYGEVSLSGSGGVFSARTELVEDLTAIAEKSLADRFTALSVRAVARGAVKYALAEGVRHGARAAAGQDAGPWVGILVGGLARALAIASEEADKRSWRTLPDELHIARLWVPPGTYDLRLRSRGKGGGIVDEGIVRSVTLRAGETRLVTERVLP